MKNFSDGLSDRGYSSMNHVDGIKSSATLESPPADDCKKDISGNSDFKTIEDCDKERQNGLLFIIFFNSVIYKFLNLRVFLSNSITFNLEKESLYSPCKHYFSNDLYYFSFSHNNISNIS